MKKLLIFDLDGTILNTLEDLKNAVNHALICKNYPIRTLEQIRKAIGNGVAMLVARSIPDGKENKDYEEVLEEFRKYYLAHSEDNTRPYKGVKEVLLDLKEKGYLITMATNKLAVAARKLMDNFFPNIFDYVQGDEIGMERKPSSMMVDTICQKFNIDKKDALYIGDTNVDMETGVNSKVDYVLVTYGYRTKEELDILCPNSPTIDSLNELSEYIKKIESAN